MQTIKNKKNKNKQTNKQTNKQKKNNERIQKFKERRDLRYIYQEKLNKTCFQLDMAYGVHKDLPKRIALDKLLCHKAFVITSISKYDGYQQGLASMVYKFFEKISKETTTHVGTGIIYEDQ